jgi:hypothetical protein
VWEAILLFLLKLGSRRQIKWLLRNNPAAILSHLQMLTREDLSSLTTIASDDTVKDLFARICIDQVQLVVQKMIRHLIEQRKLESYRLLDQYYMIAIDATGLFHRHKRHCDHCLVSKSKTGELLYSHNVLEAKLITESGLAFSIESEHIENRDGDCYDLSKQGQKQDCELKAFKRLAPKIKDAFPQLKICLLIDSLYAAQTIMDICKKYGWVFIINFKEGSIPSVFEEFESLLPLQPQNKCLWNTKSANQKISWTTDITYHQHLLHLIQSIDTDKISGEIKRYLYLTNINPTRLNAPVLANGAGRQRWKIENQGFNTQKNGGYNLEHVYSENETAAKCFYLCLQIAHIINQLIEHGSLIAGVSKKYGSLKNLSRALLDALRFVTITEYDITALFRNAFQIRLTPNSS